MSLRQKVTFTLIGGAVGMFGLMYGLSSVTLHTNYLQLEEAEVKRNVERAQEAYQGYLDQLNVVNYQWSVWDESYEFIQAPTAEYIENNLYEDVFLASGFDLIAFVNPQDQLVYGDFYDPSSNEKVPFPDEIIDYLRSHQLFSQSLDPRNPVSGFIILSDNIFMVSISPIFRSNESGPSPGNLLTAKVLDEEIAENISNRTRQTVIFHPLDSKLVSNKPHVFDLLRDGESIVVLPEDEHTIHGYSVLRDLSENPALLLETIQPRSIYQRGLKSLRFLLISFGGVTLLLGSFIIVLSQNLITLWEQQKADKTKLAWQASRDPLTGLFNRWEFEVRLEQLLKEGGVHSLCYLDLDQLKVVNDTCGHNAGDELLRQIAKTLGTQLRSTDVLARLGGDEFGVLLPHTSLEEAAEIAVRLNQAIRDYRFLWQDKVFVPSVSIGVTRFQKSGETLAQIMSAADAACYAAKNQGRNRVQVHQPGDEGLSRQQQEMEWVSELTKALSEDRFCLFLQTILSVNPTFQGEGEHYEVLLRLRDTRGNLVPPGAFIPAAERYGIMPMLDRWVIRTLFSNYASLCAQTWPSCQLGHCNKTYAINLSALSISDLEFADFLQSELECYQIPPHLVCFEITETTAINHMERATQFMHRFKKLGCRFALDDFGAGMSSFSYLKELPVDFIKIDGSFVRDILTNPAHLAIVEALCRVAHVMQLRTVAECVETPDILEKIRAIGIDYAQGYAIDYPHPLPTEAVEDLEILTGTGS
ncbi:MAG: EAL domain-containing protein [Thermostichus sp. DRC_bins_24]